MPVKKVKRDYSGVGWAVSLDVIRNPPEGEPQEPEAQDQPKPAGSNVVSGKAGQERDLKNPARKPGRSKRAPKTPVRRVEIFEGDPTGLYGTHPALGDSLSSIARGFSDLGIGAMRKLVRGIKGIERGEPSTGGNEIDALELFRWVEITSSEWDARCPGLSGFNYRATVPEGRLSEVAAAAKELARRVEEKLREDDYE